MARKKSVKRRPQAKKRKSRSKAFVGGIRIGRLAGIDILIHPSWFLVFALLSWSLSEGLFLEEHPGWGREVAWAAGLTTSLLLFGSLLLHEFSHCVVARSRGLDVQSVTLFIFGGVSSLKGEPREPADEFRIAIIGPITSFASAIVFAIAGLALWGTGVDAAAFYLAGINALLGVFNLLPGFPLDGGRVLRAAVWARTGSLFAATRTAARVGGGIAFLLMGIGVLIALTGAFLSGIWLIVIGWFLRSQADASYAQVVTRRVFERTPITTLMEVDYHPVHPQTTLLTLLNQYILQYHRRYFPVSLDGEFRGLVSASDLSRFPRDEWENRTVADAMTAASRLFSLSPDDTLSVAADLIAAKNVNQLPVLDEGRLLGFVTRADVIRVLQVREEVGADFMPDEN
jgi:Zn-dependent protease